MKPSTECPHDGDWTFLEPELHTEGDLYRCDKCGHEERHPTAPLPTPRTPTRPEFNAIAKALQAADGTDLETARGSLYGAYITIFDKFVSGTPGYCGKVAIVMFDGGPEIVATFTFDRDTGDAAVAHCSYA